MNADQELRDRLVRAADHMRIDTERLLDDIHHGAARRQNVRRVSRIALAMTIAIIVVGVVWLAPSRKDASFVQGNDSPTGRIVYGRTTSDRYPEITPGLFVLDPATSDSRTLYGDTGSAFVAQWSPDGNSIAFILEQGGGASYAILVARADGSHPVKILEHPKAEGTLGPDLISLAWSPDGSRIAYSGRSPGKGRTVSIVNADGTGNRLLEGHWESVSWSPVGDRLLLAGWPQGGVEGRFDLYTLGIDGTGLQRLTDDQMIERGASWSPDGKKIVFSDVPDQNKAQYASDIYVMDADGSNVHRITSWAGLDLFPVWSPDGHWIAFSSDREATPERQRLNAGGSVQFGGISIYVMRPDGSDVHRVLSGGNLAVFASSWTS